MVYRILLKASLKQHKAGLSGIFLLTLLAAAALGTALTVWTNVERYVRDEMQRAGFGALTVWVSGSSDFAALTNTMESLPEVDRVSVQRLIFSDYVINEQESDSEGQLITFVPEENRYRFFTDDLSAYQKEEPKINSGEIYVSPSMVSMFGAQIGDKITFPIARGNKNAVFSVKGFYEDPFMGSSMIGMKGFLICEKDRDSILAVLQNAGIDSLARNGAMLHVFSSAKDRSVSELNGIINENTALSGYTEFVHGKDAIAGFMVILQNAFTGLLLAFVLVLLLVVMAALGHCIGSAVETDYKNMGILKTVGLTSAMLRCIQLSQYFIAVIMGMICGILPAFLLGCFISKVSLTTTGILMPVNLPLGRIALWFLLILMLFAGFILIKTGKINHITPIKAICGEPSNQSFTKAIPAFGAGIDFRLALRQLSDGKHRYAGAFLVAVLLVFFASLVGRMDVWLGADGKGMMDAFNPADHDIGVQIFGNLTADEAENKIRSYTDITDTYLLAMPSVAVNGVDYTANVISEPERFHILKGTTCAAEHEIILTEVVAADLGVSVGDTVTVQGDKGNGAYVVSGIYSCANDMGGNVGLSREGYLRIGSDNPNIWCRHYFLADPSQKAVITEALEEAYGGDVHVHENTWPGLFGIISAMQALVAFMYGMVIVFILIVTVMTGSKLLLAEQKDLGIYKAIGFRTERLRMTFALRFGMVAVAGAAVGMMLAAVLTDPLVSAVMRSAGISNFASAPSAGAILLPAGVVGLLFMGFAYLAAGRIRSVNLTALISEG